MSKVKEHHGFDATRWDVTLWKVPGWRDERRYPNVTTARKDELYELAENLGLAFHALKDPAKRAADEAWSERMWR